MAITNYKFPHLSDSIERALAIVLGKITHHIHPDIVSFITKENVPYKERFKSICHKSCDINSFFIQTLIVYSQALGDQLTKRKQKDGKTMFMKKMEQY